ELDLRDVAGRAAFERLVAGAHVLVSSYRGDAFERLGLSPAALRMVNPALLLASIDAYGYTGPWRHRRGFDSLVQMSCGIGARGQTAAAAEVPVPLPAQALDHGTGYLLAAAVCRALTRQVRHGEISTVRTSLARTGRWLMDAGESPIPGDRDFTPQDADHWLETVGSFWGPLARVRCPGSITGLTTTSSHPPGPLGTALPTW